jgi:dipeptidyl aminopeptidase/acylaminoacyl peptidase
MKPADLGRLKTVGDPRLSSDGTTAAYVVTHIDMEANRYRSSVWLAATDGATAPRLLPTGSDSEAEPAWSPDGTRLALMRTELREPLYHQLVIVPADGSDDATVIDEGKEVFSGITWSPDGMHLAYARRVRDARLDPEHERDQPPRRIDTVRSRLDDVGWTVVRRRHVFVAAVDASTPPRQLTDGPFEHEHPSWSPDGRSLAFAAARHDDWDLRLAVDLWIADPWGTTPLRQLTDTTLDYSRPVWSPDGTRLAATATDERVMPHHAHLVVVDVASGAVRTLTEELDRHCAPSPGARPPIWI